MESTFQLDEYPLMRAATAATFSLLVADFGRPSGGCDVGVKISKVKIFKLPLDCP